TLCYRLLSLRFHRSCVHRHLPSFPTRRSSDLGDEPEFGIASWFAMLFAAGMGIGLVFYSVGEPLTYAFTDPKPGWSGDQSDMIGDRKSTRLNSSHVSISYAVFCLKKKNKIVKV